MTAHDLLEQFVTDTVAFTRSKDRLDEGDANLEDIISEVYRDMGESMNTNEYGECPFIVCEVRRNRQSYMDNHILHKHKLGVKSKPFKCEVEGCDKYFRGQYLVQQHMEKDHSIRKPYLCQICGKVFKGRGLWSHKQTHKFKEKERIYKCPEPGCNSDFKMEKYLKQHAKTHWTAANFLCEMCGKSYKRNECLQAHFRSQTHKTAEAKLKGTN